MARHIFKHWPGYSQCHGQRPGIVRSISFCGRVVSTREPQAATAGQHTRAGDCQECQRLQSEQEDQGAR